MEPAPRIAPPASWMVGPDSSISSGRVRGITAGGDQVLPSSSENDTRLSPPRTPSVAALVTGSSRPLRWKW